MSQATSVVNRVERLQRARTPAKLLHRLQTEARGYPAGTQDFAVPGMTPLGSRRTVVSRYVKPREPRLEEGSDLHFERRIAPTMPGERGSWSDSSAPKFQRRIAPTKRPKIYRKDWSIRRHGISPH